MASDNDKTNGTASEPDMVLDALFSEARASMPDDDLVARVLADADAEQNAIAAPPEPRRRPRLGMPSFVAALGGWGGLGGVTAAGLVGLAVGFWSPEAVEALSGGQLTFLPVSGDAWTPDLSGLALENGDV